MRQLARDFETVEASRSNFTEAQVEMKGAEEEVQLASQIAEKLRNKSQGVQQTLHLIKKALSEEEAAAASTASKTAGDASLSPKEQLEDNEEQLRVLGSLVKQAEDFKG